MKCLSNPKYARIDIENWSCLVWRKERRLRGNLITLSYLKGCSSQVDVGPWSQITNCRIRKWPQVAPARFRLAFSKSFFSESPVKHRNSLPRKVVGSPSLDVFKRCEDVAVRDMV